MGLFSFGGGYAAMPLIKNQIIDINNWISLEEFSNIIAISQMTPGPIGINSATFIGIKISGIIGAIVATSGFVLPSGAIALLLGFIYQKYKKLDFLQGILKGLRPAVIAMILVAGLEILILSIWQNNEVCLKKESMDIVAISIFMVALIILRRFKLNPIYILISSAVLGVIAYTIV